MTVAWISDTTTERPPAGADARSLETAASAAAVAPPRWTTTYVRRLVYTDAVAVAVVIAVTAAQLVRFGSTDAVLQSAGSTLSYTAVSVLLAVGWVIALAVFHTHDVRLIGSGADEYRRVAHASLALFGSVAIVAFLASQDLARGYIVVALPAGLITLGGGRWLWRRWLLRRRMVGECTSAVLVVGSHRAAVAMATTFESDVAAGYRVVGVCVPGTSRPQGELLNVDGHAVPVLGDEHAVLQALEFTGADTVAVCNTDSLGTDGMRNLAWDLDAVDVDMVVSAGLLDVAGPRLKIRPVAGLPLLHVEKPQYEGAGRAGKFFVDVVGAMLGVVLVSPLLLVVAAAIRCSSRGPVFYRAERIGLDGEAFSMLKFRSMVQDAETLRGGLTAADAGAGPLFKVRDDPRVTAVGRWIRRFSIDELPQLINVLRGQMSVVGPRPPLRSEVETHDGAVRRRLLVKPGMTGLWQVSGRSDLSWEESMRLDLSYVENWSMVGELMIVWRTVLAVLTSRGAY